MVAAKLGWDVVDTDELVERGAAMTVADLFTAQGEEGFRRAESDAIARLGHIPGPLIVSVGGGAVLRAENREAMRALGIVVWLRCPATLAARIGRGEGRPLLLAACGGGPAEVLERLAMERHDLYQQVADLVIDVDDMPSGRVADLVLAGLEGQRR